MTKKYIKHMEHTFWSPKQQSTVPCPNNRYDIRDKSIPRSSVLVEKGSNTPCVLVMQKIRKEHFVQLKTIDFNVRRISLMLRLTSTYYAFGCKKCICKNCHLRNLYGCTAGTCVACKKKFFLVNFSMLLEGDVIRYRLDSFYYCNKCLSHKNSTMNEKRFDVKQKYIPRPMANFIKSANTFSRIQAQDESGIKLMQKRKDSQ